MGDSPIPPALLAAIEGKKKRARAARRNGESFGVDIDARVDKGWLALFLRSLVEALFALSCLNACNEK